MPPLNVRLTGRHLTDGCDMADGAAPKLQGVSQITLQTQNPKSPGIMRVVPQKFHCIAGRS